MDKNKLKPDLENTGLATGDLTVAFDLLKKRLHATPSDNMPGKTFLRAHNNKICQRLLEEERQFEEIPYQILHPYWDDMLLLAAGGINLGKSGSTCAMLFQGGHSRGKTANALQLACYLQTFDNGQPPPDPSFWPCSYPLLLTANELHGTLAATISQVFGYAPDYFSSMEAIVKWAAITLQQESGPRRTFTLILDNPWPLEQQAYWQELADLIAAAGQDCCFKIIAFFDQYPPDFCLDRQEFLHHPVLRMPGFIATRKNLFIPIPTISYEQLYLTGHKMIKSFPAIIHFNFKSAVQAWSLAFFSWICQNFKQPPPQYCYNQAGIIKWFFDILEKEQPELKTALTAVLDQLGLKVLDRFSADDQLEPYCRQLADMGLLYGKSGQWFFPTREFAAGLLAHRFPHEPSLFKWQLLQFADNASNIEELGPQLKKRILDNDGELRATLLQIAEELGERDSNPNFTQYILKRLNKLVTDCDKPTLARFYFTAGMTALEREMSLTATAYFKELVFLGPLKITGQEQDPNFIEYIRMHYITGAQLRLQILEFNKQEDLDGSKMDVAMGKWADLPEQIRQDPRLREPRLLHTLFTAIELFNHNCQDPQTFLNMVNPLREYGGETADNYQRKMALFYAAQCADAGQDPQLAICCWHDLQEYLAQNDKTDQILALWTDLSLWRLNYKDNAEQIASFPALTQQLYELLRQTAPLDNRLLPVAIEHWRCMAMLSPELSIDQPQDPADRLRAELGGCYCFNAAQLPNIVDDNSWGLFFKNNHAEDLAVRFFYSAINLHNHFMGQTPQPPLYRKNYAVFLYNLGYVFNKQNRYSLAGTAYLSSLRVRKFLSIAISEDVEYQHDLALCHNVMGVLCFNCGNDEAANSHYEKATDILNGYVNKPHYTFLGKELAVVLQNHGVLKQEAGKYDEAAKLYIKAMDWVKKSLSGKNTEKEKALNRIAMAINSCAAKLHGQGRTRDGLGLLKIAIEVIEYLIKTYPQNMTHLATLCTLQCAEASLHRQLGDLPTASKLEKEILDKLQSTIRQHPDNSDLRFGLANVYMTMSRSTLHMNGNHSPKVLVQKAHNILFALLQNNPQDEQVLQAITDCMQIERSLDVKMDG